MKGKAELVTNFKWIFPYVDPTCGNVAKRNSKSMQISFSKIVKIEPTKEVQSFFQNEMCSVPLKHHFSYLSLH
jgi:hypothetical protein